MRVLLFSHSSAFGSWGGAELSLLSVIDSWRRADPEVEFEVVTRTPEGLMQPELSRRGIRHSAIDFSYWVLPPGDRRSIDDILELRMDSRAIRAVLDRIGHFAPDLVVTNTIVSPWAALAARVAGIPHVWFAREYGDLDHGMRFKLGRESTLHDIDVLSDLVVANSGALRDHLATQIPTAKLMVAYPPMDLGEELPHPPSSPGTGRRPDELRAVMVGRVRESKGHADLVRAVARLRDEGVRVRATLVGDATSPESIEILGLVHELRLGDQIDAVGESPDPRRYIAEADVGVMASQSEAFGRVTVEYLAVGRPVIAAATGANPELIEHGSTGWLYDPADPSGLADVLREAARDRAELGRRGSAARGAAERISTAYPIAAVVERIQQVVADGPAPLPDLPRSLSLWLGLPDLYASQLAAFAEVRTSASWRVGRLLTGPLRVAEKLRRRRGG